MNEFHTQIMQDMRDKLLDELLFIQKDSKDAAIAMQSCDNELAAIKYWDTYHYATNELRARHSYKKTEAAGSKELQ